MIGLVVPRVPFALILLSAAPLVAADGKGADPKDAGAVEFFEMRVRPILAKNCFPCHTNAKLGGLSMMSRDSILHGGNSGPALVPGKPEESLLIKAVRREHERFKMPPAEPLSDQDVAVLTAWVKAGSVWPSESGKTSTATPGYQITPEQRAFWAFQPVRSPHPPPVKAVAWVKSPIDRFILAKLEGPGLKVVPQADKRTWIRRATVDLIGLPPTPEEVDAFLRDTDGNAKANVVNRLLASPRYGERWARYWLDVARYSDDHLTPDSDKPYANAFRYRDWVIRAFNEDMPYDLFVKAQIAGDLLPNKDLIAGLGFYGLSPDFQDDRVDVTTRGFLGMTVACAQCHDHKLDPIPTKDFYALQGVFSSTRIHDFPLVSDEEVKEFDRRKKLFTDQQAELKDFLRIQGEQLAEMLGTRTTDYVVVAWKVIGPLKLSARNLSTSSGLDQEVLERWVKYLGKTREPQVTRLKDGSIASTQTSGHPYLTKFDELLARGAQETEVRAFAQEFAALADEIFREKKKIDAKNYVTLGGNRERQLGDPRIAQLLRLERDRYVLWRELYSFGGLFSFVDRNFESMAIDRFLQGQWKEHLERMRARLAEYKKAIPAQYPYLHGIGDVEKPANVRIQIRGNRDNLGDEAPRAFLSILSDGPLQPFTKGSGRLELAEAIADSKNPLTSRVMVNRIWAGHFGNGIVRTPSNFGMLGERPTHPELLDYLAATFVANKWSIKAMHREIMLSATYGLSTQDDPTNASTDADNRLLWRFDERRLDAEALRDSVLFVSGTLDPKPGGPPAAWNDDNHRRTVYGIVSRRKLDPMLTLFDFPNPNSTSEHRISTSVPLQELFLLNSTTMIRAAEALARRVADAGKVDAQITKAYRLLFGRTPARSEIAMGTEFLQAKKDSWPEYLQVLMSSNEFLYLD